MSVLFQCRSSTFFYQIAFLGFRIGKGEGFADLEYGMMRAMEAIDDNTIVITTVHDCQVIDIPEDTMEPHDFDVSCFINPFLLCICYLFDPKTYAEEIIFN